MHSFEVHSNECTCRKKVRLGLEQVQIEGAYKRNNIFCQILGMKRKLHWEKMSMTGNQPRSGCNGKKNESKKIYLVDGEGLIIKNILFHVLRPQKTGAVHMKSYKKRPNESVGPPVLGYIA